MPFAQISLLKLIVDVYAKLSSEAKKLAVEKQIK